MKFLLSTLGFDSFHDFLSSIVTYKYNLLLIFSGLFGATFQTHFWANPEQIVFLSVLLFLDLATGITAAFKSGSFSSRRLPRWCGIIVSYFSLLFVSFNLAKYNPILFAWLPSSLYAVFCATVFVS